MLDPEVQQIMDYLHFGHPTMGWEGDERLALYRGPEHRWELWRLCEDNVMRMICRSKPDQKLGLDLIARLVEHDARRGVDPAELVIVHNERLQAKRDADAVEALMEPTEKVLWGILKDVGHLY